MRIQSLISAAFTAAALASASIPALSWAVYPDVDFEWYANVGKPLVATENQTEAAFPKARPGYIWSPGHSEVRDHRLRWVAGHWIKDDYEMQLAMNRLEYEKTGMLEPPTLVASAPSQTRTF